MIRREKDHHDGKKGGFKPLSWQCGFNKAFLRALAEDLLYTKESIRAKFWAYRHSFFSDRIKLYGLTPDNYDRYLPDFLYYQLQPINGIFSIWLDDKLSLKYLLQPFDQYLPEYYYLLDRGHVIGLMDCPLAGVDDESIARLLEMKKCLAAKLMTGSRGKGFHKLTCHNDDYYVDDIRMNRTDMMTFLMGLSGYLITEYLTAHHALATVTGNRPCSLRIVLVNLGGKHTIAGAYMKLGTDASGYVDNISAGGIAVWVDIDSGSFSRGFWYDGQRYVPVTKHPDSEQPVEGTVPFWQDIRATILAIGDYVPQMRLMGFDIIISDEGFKIIEINSRPGLDTLSLLDPIHTKSLFSEFFRQLLDEGKR